MKKISSFALLFIALFIPASASAWNLSDLLGGLQNGDSNILTNVLEGVLTDSDISVADMAGQWRVDGSAVSFKSDNFLEKAGGVAAAAAIENKLDPYYKQYGLTGATLTINPDGSFTMTVKKITLSGTISKNADKSFEFNFTAIGAISIGSMTAYAQKSPGKLEIMFDATKLKNLASAVAKISGMSLAKTAASLLDKYEGLCVGFGLTQTGKVSSPASAQPSLPAQPKQPSQPARQDSTRKSGIDTLFDILNRRK